MHSNEISHKNEQTFRQKHRPTKHACPHWDSSNRSCLLIKDGIFLPLEQHVAIFCLSAHFAACPQYRLPADTRFGTCEAGRMLDNRRRSIRIPSRHIFRFSEMTGSDLLPGIQEEDAWTIDLSDHGIRFATRQLLPPETVIHFTVQTNGRATKIEGSGRIIWSEPLVKTSQFHAAIAFTDQIISSLSPAVPERTTSVQKINAA
jgi:hypothetical protein